MHTHESLINQKDLHRLKLEVLGAELIRFSKSSNLLEILFNDGIAISLTQKMLYKFRNELFKRKQGNIMGNIDDFTAYIHFFELERNEVLIVFYLDKKESVNRIIDRAYCIYEKIYFNLLCEHNVQDIVDFCNNIFLVR